MKKITAVLVMLLACVSLGLAQANDPLLFNGDLNAAQVKKYIMQSKFLPLSINGLNSFDNKQEKASVVDVAKEQINRHHNYMAYYNAAVVCAANAEPHGLDEFVPLSVRDATNAINYATEAIKRSPNTPYMYLLRGQVYEQQGTEWIVPTGEFEIKSHDYARKALADYEKAAEIKPSIAPYGVMASLAKSLRMMEKASKYEKVAQAQQRASDKALEEQNARRVQAQRERVRRGVEEHRRVINNNFWSKWSLLK